MEIIKQIATLSPLKMIAMLTQRKSAGIFSVLVLLGIGALECAGVVSPITSGDSIFVPANDLHQFRNLSQESLEFICIVPVESACGEPIPGS